jgi:hypothetical protein
MHRPIAVLATHDSPFIGRLVESTRTPSVVLSVDAPFNGAPVTVGHGTVTWEGLDLLTIAAAYVDAPIFSWPQPTRLSDSGGTDLKEQVATDREARSLIVSALCLAARERPFVNPMHAGRLAASPAIALDRLGRKGLTLSDWMLAPAPEVTPPGSVLRDAAGPEYWHRGSTPASGQPALVLTPTSGAIRTLLVVGERVLGTLTHSSADAWSLDEPGETEPGGAAADAEVARRATRALELELSAITVAGSEDIEVLYAQAGPVLADWDDALDGAVAVAVAELLDERGI